MDHSVPRVGDFEVDLEKGRAYDGEELSNNTVSGAKTHPKTLLVDFVVGKLKVDDGVSLCTTVSNGVLMEAPDVKVEGAESVNFAEKKIAKEKLKKSSNKKSPKPPRPPRGPSLDAADKKLMREIAELAMLKRSRIERMKALKKMKAAKSSSSNSNLFATVFTVIFFLVIIFQGVSSRTSRSSGSLSGGLQDRVISARYYGNQSPNDLHGPASASPCSVEQVAGSYPQQSLQRFIR